MKRECSAITKDTPIYHVCHFVWDFLAPDKQTTTSSAALPFEAYTIWRAHALGEETQSLLLERLAPDGAPLSIDQVRKNGCTLLGFDFIYGELVCWLEAEYTNCNVDYDTMLDNMDDLRTAKMPPGYPKVDLDQTRETLKDGDPTKCTFTSNFGYARQRAQYNNHKGMHEHIDIMMDKLAKEEDKANHLCPPALSCTSSPAS
jgi:hypothetical protein